MWDDGEGRACRACQRREAALERLLGGLVFWVKGVERWRGDVYQT